MLKVVTIVGARPQFIKAAPICRALRQAGIQEFFVHTGQHYDDAMSSVFFRDLELPEPDINLNIGSDSHGKQTGRMLIGIEEVLQKENPDWVVVYGDTNSTLAGALASVKLHIPVAHVEAGLRSFNKAMPEEHNRVVADHVSTLLFCPTQTAVKNLEKEGIVEGVHLVGDVMYDSLLHNLKLAEERSHIIEQLQLQPKRYALATVHRAENTDNSERLRSIFAAFAQIADSGLPVIIPLHPRTRKQLAALDEIDVGKLRLIEPVSYLDMLRLEKYAHVILTDSGGVQKEAYWVETPCVTLRDETEWVELVEYGYNQLASTQREKIFEAHQRAIQQKSYDILNLYGNGNTADNIVNLFAM